MIRSTRRVGRNGKASLFISMVCALLIVAISNAGSLNSSESSADDLAIIDWGNPALIEGDTLLAVWPDWVVAAFKVDGQWNTNAPSCWTADAELPEGVGGLNIDIDRAVVTNDMMLSILLVDSDNSSLYISLYDTNEVLVAEDLVGNLLEGSGEYVAVTLPVPMASHPEAVGIRIHRGEGEASVYDSIVSIQGSVSSTSEDAVLESSSSLPAVGRFRASAKAVADGRSRDSSEDGSAGAPGADAAIASGRGSRVQGDIIYVSAKHGADNYSGRAAAVLSAIDGPKKTIGAGMAVVSTGGTVSVEEGSYSGRIVVPDSVRLVTQGRVIIN